MKIIKLLYMKVNQVFLIILFFISHHLKGQQQMDYNRIEKTLRWSLEHSPRSLEIDQTVLKEHPERIHQERVDFIKNNPVVIPKDITVKDLFFKSSLDAELIRIHVYQPNDYIQNRVILYFHGGGYVFGLPEQVDAQMFRLARDLKAVILSVDYRLAPQYPFPIPIQDGYDALSWIIKNGPEQLNIKTDSITLFGISAGGHLAAAVTQMTVDQGLAGIKQQVLIYPVIHNRLNTASMNEFTDSPLWNKGYAEIAWAHFLGSENLGKSLKYADLLNYDQVSKLPETTIVACELDPLRDEGIEYASLLLRAGVKTELWVIPGAVHVFDLFESNLTEAYYEFLLKKLSQS
ncbi:alpha/beta hydrolase [Sphingobacterium sp. HJSM2_6]|uniref:alpha/beta hydrolase n=1 Tax=Sphingobacterium sp. HJSM2_6 TaxID=3366264 RepID=UPI003BE079C8